MVKRIQAIWGDFQPSSLPAPMAFFVSALGSSSAINKAAFFPHYGCLDFAVFVQRLALQPQSLAETPHTCHTEERRLPLEGVRWERRPDPANLHSEGPTAPIGIRGKTLTSLGARELWHTPEGVCTAPSTRRQGSPTDAFSHCFITSSKSIHRHPTSIRRVLASVLLPLWAPPRF